MLGVSHGREIRPKRLGSVAQRKNGGKRGQGISSGRFVCHEKGLGLILNTRGSHGRARSTSAVCSDVLIRPPCQQRESGLQEGKSEKREIGTAGRWRRRKWRKWVDPGWVGRTCRWVGCEEGEKERNWAKFLDTRLEQIRLEGATYRDGARAPWGLEGSVLSL